MEFVSALGDAVDVFWMLWEFSAPWGTLLVNSASLLFDIVMRAIIGFAQLEPLDYCRLGKTSDELNKAPLFSSQVLP